MFDFVTFISEQISNRYIVLEIVNFSDKTNICNSICKLLHSSADNNDSNEKFVYLNDWPLTDFKL